MVTMTDNDGRRISDMTRMKEKKQNYRNRCLYMHRRYVGRIFGRSRQ